MYKLLKIETNEVINNTVIINNLIFDLCNNSSIENGLCFSNKTFEMIKEIKKFNYRNIYLSKRLEHSNRYFEIIINEIYNLLKSAYDGKNTIEKIKKMKKYYPKIIEEFENWLSNYWNLPRENNLKNDQLFCIENEKEYIKAIIYYIAGMTDNFAIDTYNRIVNL